MPEDSGGTSVGKIYIDVGLRLDQADLQRVGQQAGAAVGGAAGGGGTGGMVGIGGQGGGYSGNLPISVRSAMMARVRAESALSGALEAGPLGALQSLAGTYSKQSATIEMAYPGSAFANRVAAGAATAQRQLLMASARNAEGLQAIVQGYRDDYYGYVRGVQRQEDSNAARYSRASDAAEFAAFRGRERQEASNEARYSRASDAAEFATFRGQERQAASNAARYSRASDAAELTAFRQGRAQVQSYRDTFYSTTGRMRDEAEAEQQSQVAGYRDDFYRTVARMGGTTSTEDIPTAMPAGTADNQALADAAGAYGNGSSRRTIDARRAAARNAARAARRSNGTGFGKYFALHMLGSAFNIAGKYAEAGALADERGPLAGMQGYEQAYNAQRSNLFGEMLYGGIEFMENATGRDFDYNSPGRYRRAKYDTEQSLLDTQGRGRRMVEGMEAGGEVREMKQARLLTGIRSEHERSIAEADFGAEKARRQFDIGAERIRQIRNNAQDGRERIRADKDLNAYVAQRGPLVTEANRLAEAQKDEIRRSYTSERRVASFALPGLMATAEGRFGEAEDRDFLAGQQTRRAGAYARSSILGSYYQYVQEPLERAGRRAMDRYKSGQFDYAARAANAEFMGRGGDAINERYQGRLAEIAASVLPGQQDAARRAADAESTLENSRYFNAFNSRTRQSFNDRAISAIHADSRYTPATAGLVAQVETIRRATQDKVTAFDLENNSVGAENERATGVNQLTALKRNILSGASIENISGPLGTSAGQNDQITALLQKIVDAILNLGGGAGATAQ